jgi:hypothetical protein
MNDRSTAAATSEALSVPEPQNRGIALLPDIRTPEAFKAEIDRDKQMRKILSDYVRDEMKEGFHFSKTIGTMVLPKPMLLQEGARNICSLFKLTFGQPEIIETELPDDHYRVRAHVDIYNMQGNRIASGDGICSTKEVKYAYRKGEKVCPNCSMPSVYKDKKPNGGFYCWTKKDGCGATFAENDERITGQQIGRIENPDIADLRNTVLKMAVKRAKVGAVSDVPLVSEIFAPEGDDDDTPAPQQQRQNGSAGKPTPQQPSAPAVPASIKRAVELSTKLVVDHKVEIEALAMQFLPEGVANFSDLTEEQAASVIPGLVDLLNSKINAK